jgi:hypothetical protein
VGPVFRHKLKRRKRAQRALDTGRPRADTSPTAADDQRECDERDDGSKQRYRIEAHARARPPVGRVLRVAHCDSEPVATELRSLVVVCGRLRPCPAVLVRRAGQASGDT